MTNGFAEKVVIVTGATSGIGAAAAAQFAAAGARVVLAGRRTDRGELLVSEIRARGGEAAFMCTDVTHPESVAALIASTMRRYGRLDCAFNNAGITGQNFKDTAAQTEPDWNAVIDTNLRGVWLCMKHELPRMAANGGAIVNTASIYAHVGSDFGIAPYIASKHGVLGLTRAAAVEFASARIRVNAVSPGLTRSDMTAPALASHPEEFTAQIRRNVPLGRIAEPEEIARAVLWLCSDEASYVTGATLTVDGGWLIK